MNSRLLKAEKQIFDLRTYPTIALNSADLKRKTLLRGARARLSLSQAKGEHLVVSPPSFY